MVALKPTEIESFQKKPPAGASLVLVFGSDEGLVAERGRAIVNAVTGGVDDPFTLVRLAGTDLAGDPSRLVDEALTVSMFGGRRVVWLRDPGRANLLGAVEPLFAIDDLQSLVVIEAGDLKRGTGLRKRFEDHPRAVAIACMADDTAAIGRLIDDEARLAGLAVDPAARHALESLLGADRLASRSEVRKLCLYAHGRGRITEDDVAAIVGDASAFAMDEVVDAVAGGDPETLDSVLTRLEASGTPASVAGTMVIRHFHTLQRARAEMETGQRPDAVVERLQPPVFYKRRPAVVRQLGLWSLPRIDRALGILDEAMVQSRLKPTLASALLSEAFLQLARAARAASSASRR
ncbi:DNA polymerase III subunit delta [Prosthecomicrobium sp. N25]|uniref:DNA polymerase III subunit delta n=1 Tax=Prosthecomicrobium sp. N25 TaxID=3129254 RepID=UPI003076EEFD